MTVMYFVPKPEDVAAARASNCSLATPRDSRGCEGTVCMLWNRIEDKPCEGFRGQVDFRV
jgi:hypothetical protein